MATTVGITSHASTASPIESPPDTDANNPVKPTSPKPADAGVPVIVKSGTRSPVTAELAIIGT